MDFSRYVSKVLTVTREGVQQHLGEYFITNLNLRP